MGYFLEHQDARFKPNDKEVSGLRRIEKIDFSGNVVLSDKASNTDMIIVSPGELVISGINVAKGAMAVYEGKECVSATIHYSSYKFASDKIDIAFLKYFLTSAAFKHVIKEQIPGGIKTEIKAKHLLPLKVTIPVTIQDQRKWVSDFKPVEQTNSKLQTELTHQLSLVRQLRQAFLREAMQGRLVPQFPAEGHARDLLAQIKAEKAHLIAQKKLKKDKPLPPITESEIPFEIPENWVWCRLGDATINCDGKRVPLSEFERSKRKGSYDYYGAQGVIDHIDDYKFDGNYVLIAEDGQNLLRKNKPVAFIASGKFWVNNHAHVTDCIDDITLSMVEIYLNSINLEPYISGKPPSQIKLKRSELDGIPFPLPPLPEQHRIVTKLEELMALCDRLEAGIRQGQQVAGQLLGQVLREALEPN